MPIGVGNTTVTGFSNQFRQAISNGMTNPSGSNPFVTVSYVQSYLQGLNQKPNAFWATTAALAGTWTYDNTAKTLTRTTNGALPAQDGITPAASDIGLIKNQVSQLTNGLYTVTQLGTAGTPTILTRQANMDVSSEFNGSFIVVNQGTVNAGAMYLFNYVSGFVMGTNNVAFTKTNSIAGLLKADGTVPLTADWAAGAFKITGGTSVIDFTNNKFGIGTSSPANAFVVSNGGALGFEINPADAAGTEVTILVYDRVGAAYKKLNIYGSAFNFNDAMLVSNTGAMILGSSVKTAAPSSGTATANLLGEVGTIGGALATALGLAGLGAINRYQRISVDGTLFFALGSSTSPA